MGIITIITIMVTTNHKVRKEGRDDGRHTLSYIAKY